MGFMLNQNPIRRFERNFEPVPVSGCWIWTSYTGGRDDSYGKIYVDGKLRYAHRFSYEIYKGAIPPGLDVLHICDVKLCVNPNHLYAGTDSDNKADFLLRGDTSNNFNANKTHCKRGHPLTGDNLYVIKRGRICKACADLSRAKWVLKRKEILS